MIELIEEAGTAVLCITAALSVFVEIIPVKINPLSALFKWMGQAMNKDLKDELNEVKTELSATKGLVKELEKLADMNEIKRIRAEIFAFADSCKLGEKHTEDGFLHIIDIHDDYEALLEKYEMTNGRISVDYEYIMSVYRELRAKGTFSEKKG